MSQERITFSFGKNWGRIINGSNPKALVYAKKSITDFMKLDDFKGKTFLDIGCGSGLYSLAAYELGAEKIHSIDLDPFSIESAKTLKRMNQSPSIWEISHGSIVDHKFISQLQQADIVHSWGVLHHTGAMWEAMTAAAKLVRPGGYFFVALYNKVPGIMGSKGWLALKRFYNNTSPIIQKAIIALYGVLYVMGCLVKGKNPVRAIRQFDKTHRGLDWVTCMLDRLGGMPYECATVSEVVQFMKDNFPEFSLVEIKEHSWVGNNWFLFGRRQKTTGLPVDE